MSSTSNEELAEATRKLDPIIKNVPENLTEGRKNLRKWLGRSFRVVITDGRILIGFFNCIDKDANIVLQMCSEYLGSVHLLAIIEKNVIGFNIPEKGDFFFFNRLISEQTLRRRILGSVMIPGKHIVSIDVMALPSYT